MEEQHGFAVRADLRFAIAEHAGAACREPVLGSEDILNLVADMMHAAIGVFFQKFGDRRVFAQRLQQFDLGVGQGDEDDANAMFGQSLRFRHLRAERVGDRAPKPSQGRARRWRHG